MNRIY